MSAWASNSFTFFRTSSRATILSIRLLLHHSPQILHFVAQPINKQPLLFLYFIHSFDNLPHILGYIFPDFIYIFLFWTI